MEWFCKITSPVAGSVKSCSSTLHLFFGKLFFAKLILQCPLTEQCTSYSSFFLFPLSLSWISGSGWEEAQQNVLPCNFILTTQIILEEHKISASAVVLEWKLPPFPSPPRCSPVLLPSALRDTPACKSGFKLKKEG